MDRFQEMQVFAAVAQAQGFSAAARRLGMSAASVTRAVAALEKRIGTLLLTRTTRSVHLSEAGQRYLEDCRRILAEVQEAEDSAAGSHAQTPWAIDDYRAGTVRRVVCHAGDGALPRSIP